MNKSNSLNNFGELNEEDEIAAQFEKEIEQSSYNKSQSKFLPSGATPSANGVLSPHAAEFWFPECRNCECCKGFKHGCPCCKGGVNTCTSATCIDNEFKQQVTSELASRAESTPVPKSSGGPSPRSAAPAPAAASSASETCKFESAPGGCRFGATCRFKHNFPPNPQSPTPSGGATGGGGKPLCLYFQRGNCQFGDACRFSHC